MLPICDKIENYLQLHMIYGNSKKQKQSFTFEARALQSFDNWAVTISVPFCPQLWKNSVYFWFDLQAYHQLFYQETLHPFKVCKQAQVSSK